jgi:hypothetical protein
VDAKGRVPAEARCDAFHDGLVKFSSHIKDALFQ